MRVTTKSAKTDKARDSAGWREYGALLSLLVVLTAAVLTAAAIDCWLVQRLHAQSSTSGTPMDIFGGDSIDNIGYRGILPPLIPEVSAAWHGRSLPCEAITVFSATCTLCLSSVSDEGRKWRRRS